MSEHTESEAPEAGGADNDPPDNDDVAAAEELLGEDVVGSIQELVDSARRLVSSMSGGLGDAEDKVREGLEQAEDTIRDHPLAALGIAAGIGFVVGLMVGASRGAEE